MPSERISMNVFVDFEQNTQATAAELYSESQYYIFSRPYLQFC